MTTAAPTLTADTITAAQIRALRDEATAAGDEEQAAWCDAALADYGADECVTILYPLALEGRQVTLTEAREACADAINAARAMGES